MNESVSTTPTGRKKSLDTYGLTCLLVDLQRWDEASDALSLLNKSEDLPNSILDPLRFRVKSATCEWARSSSDLAEYESLLRSLNETVEAGLDRTEGLPFQPFDALRVSSITERGCMRIARQRSLEINPAFADATASHSPPPSSSSMLGYITHDVTKPGHPMPFLISSLFRHHSLPVRIYSIKQGSATNSITSHQNYTEFPPDAKAADVARAIKEDGVTHLIDLSSLTSTLVTAVCSLRPAKVISYMGYPGPLPFSDFQVADRRVIADDSLYKGLVMMDRCYYVTSHSDIPSIGESVRVWMDTASFAANASIASCSSLSQLTCPPVRRLL